MLEDQRAQATWVGGRGEMRWGHQAIVKTFPLESRTLGEDMIWLTFNRIALAALCRTGCRGEVRSRKTS